MLVFLTVTIAYSQNNYQDVVHLKNGSIIRGIIIEQIPNESLKIETADRNVFVLNIDEVEKIAKEQIAPYEEPLNYNYVGGREWFISFGGGSNIIGNVGFGSTTFELGYYINPTNLIFFGLSSGNCRQKDIGWFHWEEYRSGRLHTNGRIHYNYAVSLLFISWSHIKDLSDKFQWRIGPSLGVLSMSNGLTYEPSYIDRLPDSQSVTETAFTFGVNTGIMWNFSRNKRWFFDLGYTLYGNTGIHFDERTIQIGNDVVDVNKKDFFSIGNKIMLSIGWRFGKAY